MAAPMGVVVRLSALALLGLPARGNPKFPDAMPLDELEGDGGEDFPDLMAKMAEAHGVEGMPKPGKPGNITRDDTPDDQIIHAIRPDDGLVDLWFEENKKRKGVTTLPTGLQYKTIKPGKGFYTPRRDSDCIMYYAAFPLRDFILNQTTDEGVELNGIILLSTMGDPLSSEGTSRLAPGEFEPPMVSGAIERMVEGEFVEVYVPTSAWEHYPQAAVKKHFHVEKEVALLFQIQLHEILQARFPTCDAATRTRCSAENLALIDEHSNSTLEELQAAMAAEKKKHLSNWSSPIQQEAHIRYKIIKQLTKMERPAAAKQKEEL